MPDGGWKKHIVRTERPAIKKKKDSKTDAAANTGPAIQENSSEKGRERDEKERGHTRTHTHTTPPHTTYVHMRQQDSYTTCKRFFCIHLALSLSLSLISPQTLIV